MVGVGSTVDIIDLIDLRLWMTGRVEWLLFVVAIIILMRFLSLSYQSLTVQLGPLEVVHRVYSFLSREMSMTTRAVTPSYFYPFLFSSFFFQNMLIFKMQIFWA